MWPFRKELSQAEFESIMDDFDSVMFIHKMQGRDIPRMVDFDKKYKMSDFSRMMKTMLISLEILAERQNKKICE